MTILQVKIYILSTSTEWNTTGRNLVVSWNHWELLSHRRNSTYSHSTLQKTSIKTNHWDIHMVSQKYQFVANLPASQWVKDFWKSVNICGSYGQEFCVLFFWHTVYILWSELSQRKRKLSPTLATTHHSSPDNAIGLVAQCELGGHVKLG